MIRPRKHRTNAPATETEHAERLEDTAACAGSDGDAWFSSDPVDIALAKSLCAACPSRQACLEGAIKREEPWGVWGGEVIAKGEIQVEEEARVYVCPDCGREFNKQNSLNSHRSAHLDRTVRPHKPIPDELHGTLAGYDRHRRRSEDACTPCRAANAEAKREAKRRKQAS